MADCAGGPPPTGTSKGGPPAGSILYFRNRPSGEDTPAEPWGTWFYDNWRNWSIGAAGGNGPYVLFSVAENDMLAATRAGLAGLGALPLVPEQRDLWSGNVLIDDPGEVGVLDWEDAEPRGLPAVDLLYLLADIAFMYDGAFASGRFLESYRASRDATTFTGGISAEALARYSAALGLDASALRPLRLLAWLPHAAWEYRQLVEARGSRAARQEVLASRFVQLWREELGAG